MKSRLLICLLTVCVNPISAQLSITAGSQLYLSGNVQLTLNNTDLINNGSFSPGTGKVSFTGSASSSISGLQPVQFYELEINKTAGSSVMMQRNISVVQQLSFTSGFLNLNGYNADLGTTGFLFGEQEASRITGNNGGQVLFSTTLNAPSNVNPANLGVIITSSQNLGNVVIKRGHQPQANAYGMGSSIQRYFDISPANNSGLTANLRFHYFDSELNSFNENTIVLWKSENTLTWTNQGFTSRNTAMNYVEKTGINSFSRWTLSSLNNPLPVRFSLFNVKCEGNSILINWKTALEQNSSRFVIERSADGSAWTAIHSEPAAGNSATERMYSFTDNNPMQKSFYRIAQYDINAQVIYTSTLKASCDGTDLLKVWPNPFSETVFVNIYTNSGSEVSLKIFDNKGALIKVQTGTLLAGSNQLSIDMKTLAKGMYQLVAEWNEGQTRKTVQLIRQ